MLLSEAIDLIKHPLLNDKIKWADLGCGDGLFTNALSQLLADHSLIYAIDKNKRSLQHVEVRDGIQLQKFQLDFVKDELPVNDLSGIIMANSFHFVKDKDQFIRKVFRYLNYTGYFIIVEYDTNRSNMWVPYPISFSNLQQFFTNYNYATEKLHSMASKYNGIIYSAMVTK